ncbi:MAG: helix-turn-helix domain-containing protein [Marinomonas sp.]
MKRYEPSRSPCPIGRASRILGDRWVILILREAYLGVVRFEDFMARLPISRAALASRLAMMTEAGLLQRDPPDAKRANYKLTEAGQALKPTYDAMKAWSGQHLFEEGDAPTYSRPDE